MDAYPKLLYLLLTNSNNMREFFDSVFGEMLGYRETVYEHKWLTAGEHGLDLPGLVMDSEGKVSIDVEDNPYGAAHLNGEEDPGRAGMLVEDVEIIMEEEFGAQDRAKLAVTYQDNDLDYSIYLACYNGNWVEGTLETDIERDDVERYLSQYGIDRHARGWKMDNVEGKLEEFQRGDQRFETEPEALKSAILQGEVSQVTYFGDENTVSGERYDSWSDEEIIGSLLSATAPEAGNVEVEVHEVGDGFLYDVELTNLDGDDLLTLELRSDRPILEQSPESEEETERAAQVEQAVR